MSNQVTLVPRNLVFPIAKLASSEFLPAYKESIKSYGDKVRAILDIFLDRNGFLAGSNCFAPIALRDLLPKSQRLVTMADLGLATEINPEFLKGFYSDTGLVLRTAGDFYEPNDSLAKSLAKQLKKRGINLNSPKVIYFDALDLKQDKNSAYGLSYVLNERAKLGENVIDASELMQDFMFRTIDERGIPMKSEKGNRNFYSRKEGLSGFCLNGDSGMDSDLRYLAASDDDGRVVLLGAEGVAKNSLTK